MDAPRAHPRPSLILTCEHGGNRIPRRYAALFDGATARAALDSHRGWDPGALSLAQRLARATRAPLLSSTTSRLLIDLNRSPGHPRLHSEFSRVLPHQDREQIRREHYDPFRSEARALITGAAKLAPVLHLSVHSFTPVLDGDVRDCDIGILYDPARKPEREFALRWRAALAALAPDLRVRLNYPYHGASDGHTTALRKLLPPRRYRGLELEINQKFAPRGDGGAPASSRPDRWLQLLSVIERSLTEVLAGEPVPRDGRGSPRRASRASTSRKRGGAP